MIVSLVVWLWVTHLLVAERLVGLGRTLILRLLLVFALRVLLLILLLLWLVHGLALTIVVLAVLRWASTASLFVTVPVSLGTLVEVLLRLVLGGWTIGRFILHFGFHGN